MKITGSNERELLKGNEILPFKTGHRFILVKPMKKINTNSA